ncbi:MAG: GNAT family N-acetyltransferase [Atribacteria sp.]|nr:GNAT family N-acetyltransferase [Candidatus Atribacteria bacterium]
MIEYKISDRIIPNELNHFFQAWKSPPSLKIKGKLLNGADLIITARENGKLIGFLTAISDGGMHAFITLVEVLEAHQGKGIGTHLMRLAVSHFKVYYDIVLITDSDKGTFYKKFGFDEIYGMHIRDFTYGKGSTLDHKT